MGEMCGVYVGYVCGLCGRCKGDNGVWCGVRGVVCGVLGSWWSLLSAKNCVNPVWPDFIFTAHCVNPSGPDVIFFSPNCVNHVMSDVILCLDSVVCCISSPGKPTQNSFFFLLENVFFLLDCSS